MSTPRPRSWLYRVIIYSSPLLAFILLEMGLRLLGYGYNTHLFITHPLNNNYLSPNADIVRRYFNDIAQAPNVSLDANDLLKDKPDNGIRVFVQGGSVAAGFPYGHGASLAAMLDQRLKQSLPNHQVEVVNLALPAVNSYSLLDFSDEIISQEPDAILIYAGHDEYLGILGLGSNYKVADTHQGTLLFIKFRELRIFQLLHHFYVSLSADAPAALPEFAPGHHGRPYTANLAKIKDIKFGSEFYQAGLEQFKDNMGNLLSKYHDAGIPVYIANTTSNIKDQPPFASDAIPQPVLQQINRLLALAAQGQHQGLLQQTKALAHQNASSTSARLHFQLGQIIGQLGDIDSARQELELAKDLDLLRFRAPEAINQIIVELAHTHNAQLVDVATRFRQASSDQLVGRNLMLDHVHPNVQGSFLIADSFYMQLRQQVNWTGWRDVSIKQAWQNRTVTPPEEYQGFASILELRSDYPFSSAPMQVNLPSPKDWQQELGKQYYLKRIDWLVMMRRAMQRYQKDDNLPMFNKTVQILADAQPHDQQINYQAGDVLSAQKRYGEAVYYYLRATRAGKLSKPLCYAIIEAYTQLKNQDEAAFWKHKLEKL